MFGFKTKKDIENEMSQWLAQPYEFGENPKKIKFIKTYKLDLISYGKVKIHLVEYEMPNGIKGRGFVNGHLTWSFTGEAIQKIDETDLLTAYCGWAWLFPNLQIGNILTEFQSNGEESVIIKKLKYAGFKDIIIGDKYKIGDTQLFEFTAHKDKVSFIGATDHNHTISFPKESPKAHLHSIYFILGEKVIQSPINTL
ncbi:MAG: hypothetical protein QM493_08135 [Sulfurovum sp.]